MGKGAASFVHRIRPRYAEVDMQGVVFNAHWLTYFDDAMTRFIEHIGFDTRETFLKDWDCMVVRAELDWRGPAGWEDEVLVAVTPVRIGNTSFVIQFLASVDERPACVGTITYVSVDRGNRSPSSIPDQMRSALEGHLVSVHE